MTEPRESGTSRFGGAWSRFVADYGMVFVLLLLGVFFSWLTWAEQYPNDARGAERLVSHIVNDLGEGAPVLVVARDSDEDRRFVHAFCRAAALDRLTIVDVVHGSPREAADALRTYANSEHTPRAVAGNHVSASWPVYGSLRASVPALSELRVYEPQPYKWPNFLKIENLLNIANQIVVIAVIAIGMTMVIITGGIDLSVGSLIALSAVVAAWLIREAAGAENAGAVGMLLAALAGIGLAGALGLFSGLMVTLFAIPPFIVTLGMMLVASGLAYIIAEGQSVYQVPDAFVWLGRGSALGVLPNAVVLMAILYIIAHIVMSRMTLGRYIYAVGGNREAARLAGVPVTAVLLFVYTVCGALAGLGGVITASQLKSGSPTYGLMYELYVIAAVVVGGTSLSGGEGRILGTLIGAFIIAVIQNGMNLTGVESYTQKVVLGLVILGAVLLDRLKRRGWGRRRATPSEG